jgi:hypothetical protein
MALLLGYEFALVEIAKTMGQQITYIDRSGDLVHPPGAACEACDACERAIP